MACNRLHQRRRIVVVCHVLALETRGLYVELLIHDGNNGLRATLDLMYPHIPHQRCLFHKLRNLWQAIQPPPHATREAARAFKRRLMQSLRSILFAPTLNDAIRLRDAFRHQWQATQPKVVAILDRAWSETVAFFRILARFPTWPRHYLQTTSLLERVNRMLRRLFRAAGAFHSPAGVLAAASRVLSPLRLI